MAKLTIKNIGPIKEVEFDLNKVNVFMGPQSSGKSTIAKIISHCIWIEKDVATNQSLKTYQENKTQFKEHFENYHKIKGYFKPDSYILYKSNIVKIKWENEQNTVNWIDQYAYKRSKIAYIPAERNMAILPEVRKVELGNTNIRSFLFDWFDAREKYTKENRLSILNLGVEYYLSENNISEEDRIYEKTNEIGYDIALSNASSGLQSVTPLIAIVDYLSKWIYSEDKKSFDQEKKQREVYKYLYGEKLGTYPKETEPPLKAGNDLLAEQLSIRMENNNNKDIEVQIMLGKLIKQIQNLFTTQNTQLIIEEPEQNLFPETQRAIIYHFFEKCLNREDNKLTITTHSPYILCALNNCMMGYLVNNQLNDDERKEYLNNNFLSEKSWINPQFVSIWEIENGKIRNIQDKDNILSENYLDKKMTELMDEYYLMLNYYKSEE